MVESLLKSITSITNVMLVLTLIWAMFSILGVQLFAGMFRDCEDSSFLPDTPFGGVVNPTNTSEYLVPPCSAVEELDMNFNNVFKVSNISLLMSLSSSDHC